MKITVAQLNPIIGDLVGNLEKLKTCLKDASSHASDLIIFPELFLTGYPPRDLLSQPTFINAVEQSILKILKITTKYPETALLLGTPLRHKKTIGLGLLNSALLIKNGEIIFHQAKTLLPTYDVFDESRYFDPSESINIVSFNKNNLGISICEDAWNDSDVLQNKSLYQKKPIEQLIQKKASIIINISASPFRRNITKYRHQLFQKIAKTNQCPVIYVNQIGGNDELIFDGNSMIFDKTGALIFKGAAFKETTQTIDLSQQNAPLTPVATTHIESIYNALLLGLKDYVQKCGFTKCILGLSGGIDSAVVCAIATKALGSKNILGITMPSPFSSKSSVEDSIKLAQNLAVKIKTIPITSIYKTYLSTLKNEFKNTPFNTTEENIQARIRGNIIMSFSNKFGYLPLATGNKSELAMGYCTLYGDMCGGLGILSDIPKTMVYDLAAFINKNNEIIPSAIITKPPSAELRPNQKDQDSLPPYEILDAILYELIENQNTSEEIIKKGFDKKTVLWIEKTLRQNEYKRLQAAPGLKVTEKAFGIGRRIPIAKKISFISPIHI